MSDDLTHLESRCETLKVENDELRAEIAALKAECDALRALMNDAMHDPEWRDKTIYPCRGEPYQNWLLQIYLPVPSDSTDKSPDRALERAIAARRRQRRAGGGSR